MIAGLPKDVGGSIPAIFYVPDTMRMVLSIRCFANHRQGRSALCLSLAFVLTSGSIPPTALAASRASAFPAKSDRPTLDLAQLDLASITVPEDVGWVTDTWQPEQVPTALVVHVQDLHTHPETQQRLSKLIGYLREQLGIQLVALEGAEGLCDTALYSDFPNPPSTKRIATLFLKEGMFTGAEHYAIIHPGEITLWGVEDEALYRQHLATYQQGTARQGDIEAILKRLREHLIPLRKTLYPKSLQRLMQLRDAYERDEDDTFQPYLTELQRLAKTAKLDLSAYPHLDAAAQAHKLWLRLDMTMVKEDEDRLVESLWPRLRRSEQERLTQLAEAVTAKNIPTAHYYQTLAQIAQAHRIRLQAVPSQTQDTAETLRLLSALVLGTAPPARAEYRVFRQYLAYLALSDEIRSGELAEELDALDEAVEQAYFTTEQQRTLTRLIRQVTLLDDLIYVKLSPARHRQYKRYKATLTVQGLSTALKQVAQQAPVTAADLQQLVDAIPTQERFYKLAMKRDEAFIRNTLLKLEDHSTKAAILIAGGFHTPGITTYLKQHNIAYLVVTPRVDGQFDESRYRAGLVNTLPPLADVLKKVEQATLQTPLSSGQNSPPTTGKLPNGPVGRQDSEEYTFPTKRHAVFFYWLNAKIAALKSQFSDWTDQLKAWIKAHPREAAMYGIALTLVAGKIVLSAMGVNMQFDQQHGMLLAMATAGGGMALPFGWLVDRDPWKMGFVAHERAGDFTTAIQPMVEHAASAAVAEGKDLVILVDHVIYGPELFQVLLQQYLRYAQQENKTVPRDPFQLAMMMVQDNEFAQVMTEALQEGLASTQQEGQAAWDGLVNGEVPDALRVAYASAVLRAVLDLAEWVARQNRELISRGSQVRVRVILENQLGAPETYWQVITSLMLHHMMSLPLLLAPKVQAEGVETAKTQFAEAIPLLLPATRDAIRSRNAQLSTLQSEIQSRHPNAKHLLIVGAGHGALDSTEAVAALLREHASELPPVTELALRYAETTGSIALSTDDQETLRFLPLYYDLYQSYSRAFPTWTSPEVVRQARAHLAELSATEKEQLLTDFFASLPRIVTRLQELQTRSVLSWTLRQPTEHVATATPEVSPQDIMRPSEAAVPTPVTPTIAEDWNVGDRVRDIVSGTIRAIDEVDHEGARVHFRDDPGNVWVSFRMLGTRYERLPPETRAHRFPSIIKDQETWPVFERHLRAAGVTDEANLQQIRQGGLFWYERATETVRAQQPQIQQAMAEALSELLSRDVTTDDLARVIGAHEAIHAQLTELDVVRIRNQLVEALGRPTFDELLAGFARMYEYPASTPETELELVEEVIAHAHHEQLLGNPLRILDTSGRRLDVEEQIMQVVQAITIHEDSERLQDTLIESSPKATLRMVPRGREALQHNLRETRSTLPEALQQNIVIRNEPPRSNFGDTVVELSDSQFPAAKTTITFKYDAGDRLQEVRVQRGASITVLFSEDAVKRAAKALGGELRVIPRRDAAISWKDNAITIAIPEMEFMVVTHSAEKSAIRGTVGRGAWRFTWQLVLISEVEARADEFGNLFRLKPFQREHIRQQFIEAILGGDKEEARKFFHEARNRGFEFRLSGFAAEHEFLDTEEIDSRDELRIGDLLLGVGESRSGGPALYEVTAIPTRGPIQCKDPLSGDVDDFLTLSKTRRLARAEVVQALRQQGVRERVQERMWRRLEQELTSRKTLAASVARGLLPTPDAKGEEGEPIIYSPGIFEGLEQWAIAERLNYLSSLSQPLWVLHLFANRVEGFEQLGDFWVKFDDFNSVERGIYSVVRDGWELRQRDPHAPLFPSAEELKPLWYFFHPFEEIREASGLPEKNWDDRTMSQEYWDQSNKLWSDKRQEVNARLEANKKVFAAHPAVRQMVARHMAFLAMSPKEREEEKARSQFLFYPIGTAPGRVASEAEITESVFSRMQQAVESAYRASKEYARLMGQLTERAPEAYGLKVMNRLIQGGSIEEDEWFELSRKLWWLGERLAMEGLGQALRDVFVGGTGRPEAAARANERVAQLSAVLDLMAAKGLRPSGSSPVAMLPAPAANSLLPVTTQKGLESLVAAIGPDQEKAQQAAKEAEARRLREFMNQRQEAIALAGMLDVGSGALLGMVPPTKAELAQILRRRFGARSVEESPDIVSVKIPAPSNMGLAVQYAQDGQTIQALTIASDFWNDFSGTSRWALFNPAEEELARTVKGFLCYPSSSLPAQLLTLVVSDEGLRLHRLRHRGELEGSMDGFGWEIRSESQVLRSSTVFNNTWWGDLIQDTIHFLLGTPWASVSAEEVRRFYKSLGLIVNAQDQVVHVVPDLDPARVLLAFLDLLHVEADQDKVREHIMAVIRRMERELQAEVQRQPSATPVVLVREAMAWLEAPAFWRSPEAEFIRVEAIWRGGDAEPLNIDMGTDRAGARWVNVWIHEAMSDPVMVLETFADKMGGTLEPLQREYLRYKIAEFRARRDRGSSPSSPSGGRKPPPRLDTPSGGQTPSSGGQALPPRISERGATDDMPSSSSRENILHRIIQSIRTQDEVERQP